MWLALTNASKKTILVDMSKVVQINPGQGGSQLIFNFEAATKNGERRLKSVNVSESIPEIGRALSAKPAR